MYTRPFPLYDRPATFFSSESLLRVPRHCICQEPTRDPACAEGTARVGTYACSLVVAQMGPVGPRVDVFRLCLWVTLCAHAENSPGEREGTDRHGIIEEMRRGDQDNIELGLRRRSGQVGTCTPLFNRQFVLFRSRYRKVPRK